MAATLTIDIDDPGASPTPGAGGTPSFPGGSPVPVIVVGPNPLPVTGVGGKGAGAGAGAGGPNPGRQRGFFDGVRGGANAVGAGVRATGQVGASVAGNDSLGAFSKAANTATSALAALGPKGAALGAVLQVGTTAVTAFAGTVNALVARGRELARVNGVIAGAAARADANRFRSDLKEADKLGPQFAKLIELQQKSDEVFRAVAMPVKEFLLDKANRMLEGLLESAAKVIDGINDVYDFLNGLAPKSDVLTRLAREIRDILRGTGGENPLDAWLNAMRDFDGPDAPGLGRDLGRPVR